MGKNIIFIFSGTGNSLWAAKKMSEELGNCEIVSMGCHKEYTLIDEYDVIGFVYPTYYRGIPAKVEDFVLQFDFQNNKNAYFFAVATCGSVDTACNATVQMHKLLKRKGIALSFAEKLDMFSNYIIFFDMRDTVEEKARQSARDLEPIIANIKKGQSIWQNRELNRSSILYIRGSSTLHLTWIKISMFPTLVFIAVSVKKSAR